MVNAGSLEGRRRPNQTPAILRVATFNMENLFDLVREPGELAHKSKPSPYQLEVKLAKLALTLEQVLQLPEIVVAQEIDNALVLQEVGDRVNRQTGSGYRAVSFLTSDRRSIEVGFLYDEKRVALNNCYQLRGVEVEKAFGSLSPSPGREPIVGLFEREGFTLRIIGVHLKSKAGISPLDRDRDALEASQEAQRVEQARVLRKMADEILRRDPRAPLLIAGDFNDFAYLSEEEGTEQAIHIVEGEPGELRLTDILNRVPEEERYTFIHTGIGQLLDHIFLSPTLLRRVENVRIHHVNAGFPRGEAKEPGTANRASDHDPVELTLRL
ncbi:MAG: endonuclease/exonuclease/phosphatase family protein [Spirochaetaceae bacterium]